MELGFISLIIAFGASMIATGFSFQSVFTKDLIPLKKARDFAYLSTIFITISSLILFYYFLGDNFAIKYVALHSSSDLTIPYKISAFWAGSEGSLLLWAWILAIFLSSFVIVEKNDVLTAHTLLVLLFVLDFFFVLLFISNPFNALEFTPSEGAGLNPLLMTHEMSFHPPTLFIGYAGSAIPFALALAGVHLAEDRWAFRARKWILFSWVWLTVGIVLGAFWAYRILGWGGFWGWDPVENASLLPWLTLTALIHSVMIQEARHGMKLWNIFLAFISFEFVMFGTFITRSGAIGSVHSFGESELTLPFTLFMVVALMVTLAIINERRDYVRSSDVIENTISKETTFLLNNLLLVAFALTVFWGVIFPMLSEAFIGYQATIGPKYYNQVTGPLAFLLLALVGACISISWRKGNKDIRRLASIFLAVLAISLVFGSLVDVGILGIVATTLILFSTVTHLLRFKNDTVSFKKKNDEMNYISIFLRKRRRYGGYIVHLGVIFVFIGVLSTMMYSTESQMLLHSNNLYNQDEYSFIYRGREVTHYSTKATLEAEIEVWKGADFLQTAYPQIEKHTSGQEINKVAIVHEPLQDVYLILNGATEEEAYLKVVYNPFVNFMWMGSLMMFFGGTFALLPRKWVLSERILNLSEKVRI